MSRSVDHRSCHGRPLSFCMLEGAQKETAVMRMPAHHKRRGRPSLERPLYDEGTPQLQQFKKQHPDTTLLDAFLRKKQINLLYHQAGIRYAFLGHQVKRLLSCPKISSSKWGHGPKNQKHCQTVDSLIGLSKKDIFLLQEWRQIKALLAPFGREKIRLLERCVGPIYDDFESMLHPGEIIPLLKVLASFFIGRRR